MFPLGNVFHPGYVLDDGRSQLQLVGFSISAGLQDVPLLYNTCCHKWCAAIEDSFSAFPADLIIPVERIPAER